MANFIYKPSNLRNKYYYPNSTPLSFIDIAKRYGTKKEVEMLEKQIKSRKK